jgi:UDP-N-acetylmuramoyl-tripeptide--D-alanyl-D-alanine ligase
MLSLKYSNIVATFKSRNQRPFNLGYMLEIDDSTQIAAMEMGITWPGDLPIYCRYFKPQIGVITNIGIDHLSDCKTLENYIKEKSKLLVGMGNKGTLILNADDENIKKISLSSFKGKVVYFGFNKMADFMGSDLRRVENGIEFTLTHDNKSYKVFIPVLGDVNAYNALAAIAAVYEIGIGIEEEIEKLKSYKNVEKHLEIRKGIKGCTIIDDTWSSNPTAADAAIRILKDYSEDKKTVAVLGRMPLLGGYTTKFHKELGETIAELGINYLVTTDEISKNIGLGAQEKGMNVNCIYSCNDLNQVMKVLNNLLDENTVVLVKTAMLDSDLYDGFVDKLIAKNI